MRLGYNVRMKTHDTIAGSYYGITSPNGCTVTDEYGALKKVIEAGDQLTIQAPGAQLIVDDDEAIVRKSTFNRAALALGLLGGGVDKWLKYAECTTSAELQAVNADYKNDLTKDGVWRWKLPKMTDLSSVLSGSTATKIILDCSKVTRLYNAFGRNANLVSVELTSLHSVTDCAYAFMLDSSLNDFSYDLPNADYARGMLEGTNIEIFTSNIQSLRDADSFCKGAKSLKKFKTYAPKLSYAPRMFYLCNNLTVCMCKFPALENGENMLDGCKLDKPSVKEILYSIPAYTSGTHKLTIGIHVDHKTDEEVIVAIEAAEAKGWTLSVQWNGTPGTSTASTYRLRRNPVYAKLGAPMEDGTRVLDWGHYVTNAEVNGYTEFASLEEAKEHFNITD